jgi:molybdopterin/thiamine biosynthesis adenylyltransferase
MAKITDITIVGLGGVGAQLLPSLSEFDVQTITMIDHDIYEQKNQTRQPNSLKWVNESKVTAMDMEWSQFMSPIMLIPQIKTIQEYDWPSASQENQLLICCVDNKRARNHIRKIALKHKMPMLMGANERYSGESHIFYPENEGTPRDPWIMYPELWDETSDESQGGGCSVDPNPQTYAANAITAAIMLHLLRLHAALDFNPEEQVPTTTKYTLGTIQHDHRTI